MKKKIGWAVAIVAIVCLIAVVGGSFYMLDYSLAPDENRADTDSCFNQLFENYPETVAWMDSLNRNGGLHDTLMTMPGGYRCHAYYIRTGSAKTAIVVHGWRDQAVKFFYLARMYEREFGYNVVIPDLYACGRSEGEAIRMGWLDREDVRCWMETFKSDTMVVHGVSMGGATTMMLSGDTMPEGISSLHFVDDCGYTSVWDEFAGQLKEQFALPAFPLMYTTSLLCQLRYGWSFGEASAIGQVAKCRYPMLFIHGDSDTFVPTEMVFRLFEAKLSMKELWITSHTEHAESYKNHRDEYISKVRAFIDR